jgi:RNA polymerase sigma-70 factor, ECF subfamily
VTDAELVGRTLAGHEDGFRTLVSRHQRAVYNLLVQMLRNPSQAEELTQDAFLKAFKALRSFDSRFKFSNWILRIAHNAAIDQIRRVGPQEVSLDEPPEEGGPGPVAERLVDPAAEDGERHVQRRELGAALNAALGRLRPEYRRLVVLRYQEELGYEEIAQVTGLPLGTVKSHLHRARAEMAEDLRRRGLG